MITETTNPANAAVRRGPNVSSLAAIDISETKPTTRENQSLIWLSRRARVTIFHARALAEANAWGRP